MIIALIMFSVLLNLFFITCMLYAIIDETKIRKEMKLKNALKKATPEQLWEALATKQSP